MESSTLRTERLELRPGEGADLNRILEYRNLPATIGWLLRTEVDPDSLRAT
jgi:hypothetical protein